MKNIKAFPNDGHESKSLSNRYDGMDLRDYFAAKAMQGLLANDDNQGFEKEIIALFAYSYADAMLRMREYDESD